MASISSYTSKWRSKGSLVAISGLEGTPTYADGASLL